MLLTFGAIGLHIGRLYDVRAVCTSEGRGNTHTTVEVFYATHTYSYRHGSWHGLRPTRILRPKALSGALGDERQRVEVRA